MLSCLLCLPNPLSQPGGCRHDVLEFNLVPPGSKKLRARTLEQGNGMMRRHCALHKAYLGQGEVCVCVCVCVCVWRAAITCGCEEQRSHVRAHIVHPARSTPREQSSSTTITCGCEQPRSHVCACRPPARSTPRMPLVSMPCSDLTQVPHCKRQCYIPLLCRFTVHCFPAATTVYFRKAPSRRWSCLFFDC